MIISELETLYKEKKDCAETNPNELLDFVKALYLSQKISLSNYSILVKQLEEQGATNPNVTFEKQPINL